MPDESGISPSVLSWFAVASLPYPYPNSEQVSARMRANRKRDTKPEIAVRSLLHAKGLRFRKHYAIKLADRTVRPDIVFTRRKVAVFIDGCFWHACAIHGNVPRANTDYWSPKLQRNVERDLLTDAALAQAGWRIVRVWEHEQPSAVAAKVAATLAETRPLAG